MVKMTTFTLGTTASLFITTRSISQEHLRPSMPCSGAKMEMGFDDIRFIAAPTRYFSPSSPPAMSDAMPFRARRFLSPRLIRRHYAKPLLSSPMLRRNARPPAIFVLMIIVKVAGTVMSQLPSPLHLPLRHICGARGAELQKVPLFRSPRAISQCRRYRTRRFSSSDAIFDFDDGRAPPPLSFSPAYIDIYSAAKPPSFFDR